MIRKITTMIAAAILTAALAVSAFAGAPVTGKVTKVEGEKVTVAIEGAMPAWAKKGASVTAEGENQKIVGVQGNEVTIKFSKSKAAKIAVDSKLTMTECEGEELQGC